MRTTPEAPRLRSFAAVLVFCAATVAVVAELNALRNIDIAFLPMNLPPDRTAAIMVDTVKAMKPRVLYPHHYGDVGPWEAVRQLQALSGTEVRIRDMR